MAENIEYLSSSIIKEDPWVKKVCAANSTDELANLFLNRLMFPQTYGPYLAQNIEVELPAEVIYDLIAHSYIEHEFACESFNIILNKILRQEVTCSNSTMENIFYLIEQLVAENCSANVFSWIKSNSRLMTSKIQEERQVYLSAVNALVFSQKGGESDILQYWKSLWNQSIPFWWGIAFYGIRYSNVDSAIVLIPELIERKCPNTSLLLKSIWKVDDDRVADFFKIGILENKKWAGEAINIIAHKMKWAEKTKLLNKLYNVDSFEKDDDEGYLSALGH